MKLIGIYAIRCKNRIYIGKTSDIVVRWGSHLADLSKRRHANKRLQADFDIHGLVSLVFTILEICELDDLDTCEKKHILTLRHDDYNVNVLKSSVGVVRGKSPRLDGVRSIRQPRNRAHTSPPDHNIDGLDHFVLMSKMQSTTGYSEVQIVRLEREGVIPRRRVIGKRKTAWLASEIREWMQKRPRVR